MAVQVSTSFSEGTVVSDRYRIQSVLGQGGFGRTYLVQDLQRFEALCVLKELTPPAGAGSAVQKAKELFYREARVLHRVNHLQIPKLLAYVETEDKLLLVEELVVGKTYLDLLRERGQQNQAFSEIEILRLLWALLPVLHYLHGQGLIHRDIAPDNIMRAEESGKPVLIDFGLVKPMLKDIQLQQASALMGKQGFSPPEQISFGQCSPASDIYALGVTLIVLLTGRMPMELVSGSAMTLDWKPHVQIRPETSQILDRMIEPLIRDRYPSAAEVRQDLQRLRNKLAAASSRSVSASAMSLSKASARSRSDLTVQRALTIDSAFPVSKLPPVVLSREELEALVLEMRGLGGLDIRSRRHNFKTYLHCFVGEEVVAWLKAARAMDTESAIYACQQLIELKVIHHVTDSHSFKNEKLFYRFYVDETDEENS